MAFVFSGFYKGAPGLSWVPIDLTAALAVATALACTVVIMIRGSVPKLAVFASIPFVLFIPAAFSMAHTPYATEKVLKLFTFTWLSMLAPVLLVRTDQDTRRFIRALFLTCGLITLTSLLLTGAAGTLGESRLVDPSGDPISLGVAAGIVLIIAAGGLLTRTMKTVAASSALFVGALALLHAGSRGPIVGVAAAVLGMVLLPRGRRRMLAAAAVVVLMGISGWVGWRSAPGNAASRIVSIVRSPSSDTSLEARLALARIALGATLSSPSGVGWGGYEGLAAQQGFPSAEYPHNIILEILVEAGWIVGLAFCWFLLVTLRRATLSARGPSGVPILGIVLFTLLGSLVSGELTDRTLFLAVGLSLAHSALYMRQSLAQKTDVRGMINAR